MPEPSLSELAARLDRLHAERQAVPLNLFGELQLSVPGLGAVGASTGGPYTRNSDNLGVFPFRCGAEIGVVMGVCTGNYKDMGTAVAAGASVATLADCFATPLLSEADLAPTLRRWVLQSDERIQQLSKSPLGEFEFGTVMGRRDNLHGIGCSVTAVAALSHRIYGIHLGEGKAFLIRHGASKKLTIEHTLAHAPEFRAGTVDFDAPELVVLRALGFSENPPEPDVFRTDVELGDTIVLGNLALSDKHTQALPEQSAGATVERLLERIAEGDQWCPAAVGCIQLETRHPHSL